ncbi:MAG: carboxypeptidase-like regulatory domain-containing protein [Ferruginibacter sp.]
MKLRALHSWLLMFLFGTIISVSCKKDIKNDQLPVSPGDPLPIPAASAVNGSVSGLIVDENNTPVAGAVAKLGALSAITNAKGVFSFDHATLDKYITTVTVEVPGYFKAYRSFSANATRNYINIKLLKKTISGTVNSTSGGSVSLSNGTQLSFQANSVVVKSTGAPYSGNVKVYASYIDPTASDISTTVPGSFMGRDANNIYSLQSTGMIAVDLEADNGEALQLASNLPATIKMPIPASLLSKAPSSIDTWSLDEQGVWKKEGSAPKTGDFYEMQVTHFSFWNCDVPCNAVYLNIHLQDQNGNSMPNTVVQLSIDPNNTSWWSTSYGVTDSLGNVSGLVPGAQELVMIVLGNSYTCTTPLYTQTIGPFTTTTSITVTANITTTQSLTITGTAVDCSNNPIQNGTAIIYAGLYNYYNTTIVNGEYSVTMSSCNNFDTVNVTVIDYTNSSQGNSGSVSVSGGGTVTVPPINVCGGGSAQAEFTFGNGPGGIYCEVGNSAGTYTAGTPIMGANYVTVMVNVTVPGAYNITTPVVNGFSFSSSGTFNNVGQEYVYLIANGTPVAGGSYDFITQAGSVTGCTFSIYVSAPPANIDLQSCSNIIVNGTYQVGVPLNNTNTVTVTLNVLSPGQYFLYSYSQNGFYFTDSGYVTTTGPTTFTLTGSGASTIAGTYTFSITQNGGPGGCGFDITVTPASTNADFTFNGAPGNCLAADLSGLYIAGTALNGQNGVNIQVNVTTPGAWSITTNSTNGFSFSGSGYLFNPGLAWVYLTASGTPTSSGSYTFIPQAGGAITGCAFIVPVN